MRENEVIPEVRRAQDGTTPRFTDLSKEDYLGAVIRQSGREYVSGQLEGEFAEVVCSPRGADPLLISCFEDLALESLQLNAPLAVVCADAIERESDHMECIVILPDLHE